MIKNKTLGSFLLVAGTCIGVGMIALPVSTAPSGFIDSTLLISLCWLFMYFTGLMVTEVYLSMHSESSYISMARSTLGPVGETLTWLIFIFLLYSLLAAYITAGGDLIIDALHLFGDIQYPFWFGYTLWTVSFTFIIFMGVQFADFVNRFFMVGLFIALGAILIISVPHIHFNYLRGGDPKYLLSALPVVFTSLGFHIVVPSLCIYLEGNVVKIKRAILWGSLVPLVVFILWEAVVFGIVPMTGETGLISILKSGHASTEITHALIARVDSSSLGYFLRIFLFFALTSSFVGVGYGLFDLLADGFKLDRTIPKYRVFTSIMTLLPPFVFALTYPRGFMFALGYAGICVALVHGLLPVCMTYGGRYVKHFRQIYRVFGGKILLVGVALFFIVVIYADVAANLSLIPVMG